MAEKDDSVAKRHEADAGSVPHDESETVAEEAAEHEGIDVDGEASASDDLDDELALDDEPAVVGSETRTISDLDVAGPPQMGILTAHFPERDVDLVLDGPSALRLLAKYAHGIGRGDRIDPLVSPSHSLWVAVDLERALALTWWPRLPKAKTRVAVDPPLSAEVV